MKKDSTQDAHEARIRDVLVHVRDHIDGRLSLDELAERACQSPYHFLRVFREQTGRTSGEHVRQVRLFRAALDLRLTDRSVMEIALDVGGSHPDTFTRAFARAFGLTPSAYRAKHRPTTPMERRSPMKDLTPQIGLVKIPVTDFAASTRYYREVLGLDEEFAVEQYGWAQYRTGGVPLCLYVVGKGGGDGTPGGETGFHIVVSDIAAAHRGIEVRGGAFASDLVTSDDGGSFFLLQDPDGNVIKVLQSQT